MATVAYGYKLYSDGQSVVLVGPNGTTHMLDYCIQGLSWTNEIYGMYAQFDVRSFGPLHFDSDNTKPPNIINLDKVSIDDLLKIVYERLQQREEACSQRALQPASSDS